ncbi:hypothetical protein C6A36_00660 [Desulfobacteraceae bacterium SEEP-SAG10]|nr:hypothetical protein C6A36_00660 [Desulfobacteraceae bacterium SEEP-SAG10]
MSNNMMKTLLSLFLALCFVLAATLHAGAAGVEVGLTEGPSFNDPVYMYAADTYGYAEGLVSGNMVGSHSYTTGGFSFTPYTSDGGVPMQDRPSCRLSW